MKPKVIFDIIKILGRGENIGDVAVLKLTVFNDSEGLNALTERALSLKELNFTPLDLEALSNLPPNTLGYAYAEFMRRNGLQPFNFSQRVDDLFEKFPVSTRYARVHDLIHTLLGFEADLAGELGVYAFVHEQKYTRFLNQAYRTGRWVTRLMKPWGYKDFAAAEERGRQMAQGAKILVLEPLENYLSRDLTEVRRELVPGFFLGGR